MLISFLLRVGWKINTSNKLNRTWRFRLIQSAQSRQGRMLSREKG